MSSLEVNLWDKDFVIKKEPCHSCFSVQFWENIFE